MDRPADRPPEPYHPPRDLGPFADPPLARGGSYPAEPAEAIPYSAEFPRPPDRTAGSALYAAGVALPPASAPLPEEQRGPDEQAEGPGAEAGRPPIEPPPAPPPVDLAPEPEDPAERASRDFDARTPSPPTATEILQVVEAHDATINWLSAAANRPPIANTFGGGPIPHDRSDPELQDIPPEQAPRIVDRQMGHFGTTIFRVDEAITATNELAELAEIHAGRTLIVRNPPLSMPGHIGLQAGRFNLTVNPTETGMRVDVEEWTPGDVIGDERLSYRNPEGEVQLITPDAAHRQRFFSTADGDLVQISEHAYEVKPDDAANLRALGEHLATYKNLLLDMAEQAGFAREAVDPRGQMDLGQLLNEVEWVIGSPDFGMDMSADLRDSLESRCQTIAQLVNGGPSPGSLSEIAPRLNHYFLTALGRPIPRSRWEDV